MIVSAWTRTSGQVWLSVYLHFFKWPFLVKSWSSFEFCFWNCQFLFPLLGMIIYAYLRKLGYFLHAYKCFSLSKRIKTPLVKLRVFNGLTIFANRNLCSKPRVTCLQLVTPNSNVTQLSSWENCSAFARVTALIKHPAHKQSLVITNQRHKV